MTMPDPHKTDRSNEIAQIREKLEWAYDHREEAQVFACSHLIDQYQLSLWCPAADDRAAGA